MILPVRKNLGTNCPASKTEIMSAVANPATRCSGKRNAATISKTPVIRPGNNRRRAAGLYVADNAADDREQAKNNEINLRRFHLERAIW